MSGYILVITLWSSKSFFFFRERISLDWSGWTQVIFMPPQPPEAGPVNYKSTSPESSGRALLWQEGGQNTKSHYTALAVLKLGYVCFQTQEIWRCCCCCHGNHHQRNHHQHHPSPCAGWVCIFPCVVIEVGACGGQRPSSGVFLNCSPPWYYDSLSLKPTACLFSYVSYPAWPGHPLLLGLQVGHHTYLAFTWVLGILIPVLCGKCLIHWAISPALGTAILL